MRFAIPTLFACAVAIAGQHSLAQAQPRPPEAKDMTLLGVSDLQARSAYQPLVR